MVQKRLGNAAKSQRCWLKESKMDKQTFTKNFKLPKTKEQLDATIEKCKEELIILTDIVAELVIKMMTTGKIPPVMLAGKTELTKEDIQKLNDKPLRDMWKLLRHAKYNMKKIVVFAERFPNGIPPYVKFDYGKKKKSVEDTPTEPEEINYNR